MFLFRCAGAPINFETVEINCERTEPEHLQNALLSVKRNGVALKGQKFLHLPVDTHTHIYTLFYNCRLLIVFSDMVIFPYFLSFLNRQKNKKSRKNMENHHIRKTYNSRQL